MVSRYRSHFLRIIGCVIILFLNNGNYAVPVDCIIFSYNRPMQLFALLESMEQYLTGIADVVVICRSDERFKDAYDSVQARFSSIKFVAQTNPPYDFKPLLLVAFDQGASPYLMFGVDDIIVKNYADLDRCTDLMERTGAYSFYLRLGFSVNTIFPTGQTFALPPLQEVAPSVYAWNIMDNRAVPYWGYPNTVDMTIYRKEDIRSDLQTMAYKNPNILEGTWCGKTANVRGKKGLCFADSIIVNIVVNQVQTEWYNPHQQRWSPDQLLDLFLRGFCIDTTKFFAIKNQSCHLDCSLPFVER